jgi:hypothetical protein
MSEATNARLEAFPAATGEVIRVAGRATLRESRIFHEYARRRLDSAPGGAGNEDPYLILDVSACERFDSTFLGCLVDLHKRFNRDGHTLFAVAGPASVRKELLGACRLDRLLPLREEAPTVLGAGTPLQSAAPVEARDLGIHVMECHRRLAEEGGPASEAFARVADQLEKELSGKR